MNNFFSISNNICFGFSKELSHWDGAYEYPQHVFWMRNKKLFLVHILIGIASIKHIRNKISNTHGWSPNVVKMIFHTLMNCFNRKEFAPYGSKFFPFREVPILKRDVILENHCFKWYSSLPLMCVTFSAFQLRHCKVQCSAIITLFHRNGPCCKWILL